MKESFASRVFQKIRDAGECRSVWLARELEIPYGDDAMNRRFYSTLRDLRRSGKIERVETGVYRPVKAAKPEAFSIATRMWRILRAKRSVSVEDMLEMAGASGSYAREWLGMLDARGVVRRAGDKWVLVNDTVEMPENEAKAERLRALRARMKAGLIEARRVLEEIEGAYAAITEAEDGQ